MPHLLIISLAAGIFISTISQGFFSFAGIMCVILWYLCTTLLFLFPKTFSLPTSGEKQRGRSSLWPPREIQTETLFTILIFSYILYLFFPYGIYHQYPLSTTSIGILSFLLIPLIMSYSMKNTRVKHRFFLLIASAAVIKCALIISSPAPAIDVFYMLRDGALSLLSGHDPYSSTFTQVYPNIINNYYTYWPATLLFDTPFVYFFHDQRILYACGDIATALMIWHLGKRTYPSEILSILFLFRPQANFILEQSWLAPLEMCLIAAAWVSIKSRRATLLGVSLGLLAAIKQQYLLLIPLYAIASISWKRTVFISSLVIFLVVLPFYLWDRQAFYADTVTFLLQDPSTMTNPPIHLALTLNTAYYHLTSHMMKQSIMAGGALLSVILVLSNAWWRRSQIRAAPFLPLGLSTMSLLLGLYLWNAYAFINYYYALTGICILTFITLLPKQSPESTDIDQ